MNLHPGGMRRFHIERDEDESGVSGTGRVAEGVQFHDGQCALKWLTHINSLAIYPDAAAVEVIHGHKGKTRVVWDDA
jgi:hypothetical protein